MWTRTTRAPAALDGLALAGDVRQGLSAERAAGVTEEEDEHRDVTRQVSERAPGVGPGVDGRLQCLIERLCILGCGAPALAEDVPQDGAEGGPTRQDR